MGYEKDSGEKESTTIQEKSWQDSSGNDSGTTNNPNNNGGFTDNSQSAKEALQLQKMAESSSEYIQLKKWADNIGGGGDPTPNDNPIQKKENKTGLPDKLKAGMENNSGMPLDDVKVHRNSEKPAQLQAHAYAQGTDIHLGPGQEKHLPHELGHVVQQKQGIVKPTTQQNGAAINDDKGLEKNADTLGAKALQPTAQLKAKDTGSNNSISNLSQVIQQWQMEDKEKMNNTSIQRKVVQKEEDMESLPEDCSTEEDTYDQDNPPNESEVDLDQDELNESEVDLGEEENEEFEKKRSILSQLANNTAVNKFEFNFKVPGAYGDDFNVKGFIKMDLGTMSVLESELHIYFEGKAFDGIEEDNPEEGVKKDPDFKPLDIKISNKGDGFNLENIGFSLGFFSLNINPAKPSIAFNGFGLGLEATFDHANDKVVLKPSLDVLGALFGDQLEKEVEKWQKSLGENIKAKVTATLPFEATYEIPLKTPLSYRLENANFKPKFGIEIMADVGGGVGVDVGASASIETDYAEGKEGDEFTTTTGNVEAHLKVIIFGQKFGPETQAEVKQTGTLWESVEMQKGPTCFMC